MKGSDWKECGVSVRHYRLRKQWKTFTIQYKGGPCYIPIGWTTLGTTWVHRSDAEEAMRIHAEYHQRNVGPVYISKEPNDGPEEAPYRGHRVRRTENIRRG